MEKETFVRGIQAPLSKQVAHAIYDMLVTEASAAADADSRFQFVAYVSERRTFAAGTREYRFSGSLGFGGKFYVSGGRAYVSCYPEDQTPERLETIKRCNTAINALFEPVA